MNLSRNTSRLVTGAVLILVGLFQVMQRAEFHLWLVLLVLGIQVIMDSQAR